MRILVLNASPREKGTVYTELVEITRGVGGNHEVEWVDVCGLEMKHCTGCMVCREKDVCILPRDDAHRVGERIAKADALVVGTPVHWGNMSAPLKQLFDRNVPVFIGEGPKGRPVPRQKGKSAVLATACTAPWPFNVILPESRGVLRAVRQVLGSGGYRILGAVVQPGTRAHSVPADGRRRKARRLGARLAAG